MNFYEINFVSSMFYCGNTVLIFYIYFPFGYTEFRDGQNRNFWIRIDSMIQLPPITAI